MLAYAKALVAIENIQVFMLSTLYPDDMFGSRLKIHESIYIRGKKSSYNDSSTFFKRTLGKIFRIEKFGIFLKNVNSLIDKFDGQKTVFIYPSINNYWNEKALLKLIKSKNIPIFSERNELNIGKVLNNPFPKNIFKKIIFGLYFPFKIIDHYYQDKLVAKYNGNIVISKTMEHKVFGLNKNLIRIPILVDIEKYNALLNTKPKSDLINIGFTGSLNLKKDGIDELIKSIALLYQKYSLLNVKLNLYGTAHRDTIANLKRLIFQLDLQEKVILHGNVTSKEIPEVLKIQDILILTRPVNLQTRYGFSTKLAEYMASGSVVLTTDVSDNLVYIVDGENGFVSESYKSEETAAKLYYIIRNNYHKNQKISKSAHKTALKHFNSLNYSKLLKSFLFPEN